MARNYEKNFGQLNRLWLARNSPDKPPKRPRIESLNTVEEIRKWLPVVKEEINFCLTQSQVPCYTDRKVSEYHKQILKLEIEYKRLLKKAKSLDSKPAMCLGNHRPYEKKRKELGEIPNGKSIPLPILELPENLAMVSTEPDTTIPLNQITNSDAPLQFKQSSSTSMNSPKSCDQPQQNILGVDYSSSDDDT